MFFHKKNNTKTKKSDYQLLKEIIFNNENQAAMDEAINNWQIDADNMDGFTEELSENYNELCMEHVPFAI